MERGIKINKLSLKLFAARIPLSERTGILIISSLDEK